MPRKERKEKLRRQRKLSLHQLRKRKAWVYPYLFFCICPNALSVAPVTTEINEVPFTTPGTFEAQRGGGRRGNRGHQRMLPFSSPVSKMVFFCGPRFGIPQKEKNILGTRSVRGQAKSNLLMCIKSKTFAQTCGAGCCESCITETQTATIFTGNNLKN